VARQEDGNWLQAAVRQLRARRRVADAAGQVPLGAAGRALLGQGAPWFESWLEHPDPEHPFWQPLRCGAALERVRVPVLLIGGWQDLFLQQTLEQYQRLRDRGVDVALTVGPWTHTRLLTAGLAAVSRESLQWLETHLGAAPVEPRPGRVRVFVTGQGWSDLPDWPPATDTHAFYLHPGGRLGDASPTTQASVTFRYDPADPTPTVGGRLLSPDAGYRDDSRLARRDDVLSFTGEPLTSALCVQGNPVVELRHSADIPHVDLFVRISEVDAGGRSRNVSDGYRRLTGAQPDGALVTVELDAIAHRFSVGSRIRVLVAGGSHPRYARNLGAGEPVATGRQVKAAVHTVHLGPSRLLLPVQTSPAGSAHDVAHAGGDIL
jgi:putative CocE/NonD family hydrolase